ncbi:MAG: hypothetical protein MJ211_14120 [Bacteroidales bacterium]|nr:hypothetical protein [Bacteroidales bacterium]
MSSNINVLNNNDQYIKLEDIIKNKPKLIIRYTSLTCNSCVDTLITYAKKVVKRIGRENVIVFAQYESLRDFHLFNRINKNYIDIYRVEDKITKLDYSDTPYMFILNPDKSISHLYIPHKEVPHLISWYFNQVEPILN